MSISLSVFFTEPLAINVAFLSSKANEIFHSLLGSQNEPLNIIIQDLNGLNIQEIKPDSNNLYGFVEANLMCRGGYISYELDECWKYHSDRALYEFCITEIKFDDKNPLFIIILSMLIAVAQYANVDFINDTHGVFFETSDDQVNINNIFNLKLSPRHLEIFDALGEFYSKLKIQY